jgi:protein TonB
MIRSIEKAASFLRAHAFGFFAGVLLALLVAFAIHWIGSNRNAPPPRKVMQFTVVNVQPQQPKPLPPPPPPVAPPKVIEQPQATRVELKASDIPPPDAPPPSAAPASSGPPAGPLALAAEGEGRGDAFNLAGNPGGRGLLSGGGLGDGSGDGNAQLGSGGGTGNRYAWYYARVASDLEDAFRKKGKLMSASTRVELRVWTEPNGRISRVQLVRSTGDRDWDEAIQSIVGSRVMEPPSQDIPMPMILRLTARRLQ